MDVQSESSSLGCDSATVRGVAPLLSAAHKLAPAARSCATASACRSSVASMSAVARWSSRVSASSFAFICRSTLRISTLLFEAAAWSGSMPRASARRTDGLNSHIAWNSAILFRLIERWNAEFPVLSRRLTSAPLSSKYQAMTSACSISFVTHKCKHVTPL